MSFLINPFVYLSAGATLTADKGTFTLTGVNAAFLRSLKMTAGTGTFTLTGNNAGLSTGIPDLVANAGTFTLTGNAAALSRALRLAASSGSFSLTGNAAVLSKTATLLANGGSFSLSGVSASFARALVMSAASASFTLTGNNATISKDPNFASVVLLTNFNGVDGATSASDNSFSAHSLTFNGNAQLDTGVLTPWGAGSLLLDGTGDWVSAGDSADWQFSGEFTIEGWARLSVTGTCLLFGQSKESSQRSIRMYFEDTGTTERFTANFWVTDVSTATHNLITGDLNTATGTWFHWAFSRDSSNKMRVHIDGVMQASKTSATGTNFNSNSDFRIGGQENNSSLWNGNMAEIRVTKGVCRYPSDSSFTPPTAAFPRGA